MVTIIVVTITVMVFIGLIAMPGPMRVSHPADADDSSEGKPLPQELLTAIDEVVHVGRSARSVSGEMIGSSEEA